MEFDKKKWDTLVRALWAMFAVLNTVALAVTRENLYGFLMLACILWFLDEDRAFKAKYSKKTNGNKLRNNL